MPVERSPVKNQESAEFAGFPEEGSDIGSESVATDCQTMDAENVGKLKSLFRQRQQALTKVFRINKAVEGIQPLNTSQLKVFVKNLQSAYTEFSNFHSQVIGIVDDADLDGEDAVYQEFEDLFNETSAAVEMMLENKESSRLQQPQVVVQQQPLKAPIPTFDGDCTKWPKFKAMFRDVMSLSKDSNAIKLSSGQSLD